MQYPGYRVIAGTFDLNSAEAKASQLSGLPASHAQHEHLRFHKVGGRRFVFFGLEEVHEMLEEPSAARIHLD
jgi:hypothetical protein